MNRDLLENIVKQILEKRSSSILISHPNIEHQLSILEEIITKVLEIPKEKHYKTHPDVFGIWPENITKRKIEISQVREFIRKTQLKPYTAKMKFGLIAQAERMSRESQNTLLKTLEEPPANTVILISTSNSSKLLQTILSRLKIFEFLDKKETEVNSKMIQKLMKSDIIQRFQYVEELINNKKGEDADKRINDFIENLLKHYRRILLTTKREKEKVLEIIELIEKTNQAIEQNVSKRLALENLMINLPLKGVDY